MIRIFDWPRTVETPGLITIVGWHQTPTLQKIGRTLTTLTGLIMLIHTFFAWNSLVNRAIVDFICFFFTHWAPQDVGAGWLISQFLLGLLFMGTSDYLNLYALLLQTRTTVRVAEDRVEIHGLSYPRSETEGLQFVTHAPQASRTQNGPGGPPSPGSGAGPVEDGRILCLAYGWNNNALVTIFLKPQHASRFALACNAALKASMPPTRGFEVLQVIPLEVSQTSMPVRHPATVPIPVRATRRK